MEKRVVLCAALLAACPVFLYAHDRGQENKDQENKRNVMQNLVTQEFINEKNPEKNEARLVARIAGHKNNPSLAFSYVIIELRGDENILGTGSCLPDPKTLLKSDQMEVRRLNVVGVYKNGAMSTYISDVDFPFIIEIPPMLGVSKQNYLIHARNAQNEVETKPLAIKKEWSDFSKIGYNSLKVWLSLSGRPIEPWASFTTDHHGRIVSAKEKGEDETLCFVYKDSSRVPLYLQANIWDGAHVSSTNMMFYIQDVGLKSKSWKKEDIIKEMLDSIQQQ